MKNILTKTILAVIRLSIKAYKKLNNDKYKARIWSNNELKKIAYLFTGSIINVSGGNDGDKENSHYSNYFKNKGSYTISNYKQYHLKNDSNEVILDLEQDISEKLKKSFDVIFTHTVLEHIYNFDKAIQNLCELSTDVVITIVPFLQTYHHEEEFYQDFWRYSPLALIKKFNEYHFKTVYVSWNNDPLGNLYVLHVASCKPNKWHKLIQLMDKQDSKYGPGLKRHQLQSSFKDYPDRIRLQKLEELIKS